MEKVIKMNNYEKLLTYKNGKLLIEGYDLGEIANMYEMSVENFLFFLRVYLSNSKELSNANCKIATSKMVTISGSGTLYESTGEVLVADSEYEKLKKIIFDLAYTKCSNIKSSGWDRHYDNEELLAYYLTGNCGSYSCVTDKYPCGWVVKFSGMGIDRNDQEKRYSLLRKKD